MPPELQQFHEVWARDGLHGALGFLNARTPHRYTGIYRFDGETLRNEVLFDRFDPQVRSCDDVPAKDAYCSLLRHTGDVLSFEDARKDPRLAVKPGNPVISYYGVLIRDREGRPFGSLCHYDVRPCESRPAELPLLQAIAEVVFDFLISKESYLPPPPPARAGAISG